MSKNKPIYHVAYQSSCFTTAHKVTGSTYLQNKILVVHIGQGDD